MHIVAIHGLKEDREKIAAIFAASLGVTKLEALSRLRAPGTGPLVVRLFSDYAAAERLAARLESGEIPAVVLNDREIEQEAKRFTVKRFSFGEREILAESCDGGNLAVSFTDVELILRGTEITSRTETETTVKRSLSLGRAVLTGGLMMTKTTKTVQEITTGERGGFISIYAADKPILFFHEDLLAFDCLGTAMKPSRSANFGYMAEELRRLCPGASYDDLLLSRASQSALLGPTLTPERHLHVATALLAKVLRRQAPRD